MKVFGGSFGSWNAVVDGKIAAGGGRGSRHYAVDPSDSVVGFIRSRWMRQDGFLSFPSLLVN